MKIMKKLFFFVCCLFLSVSCFAPCASALDVLRIGSSGRQIVWLQRSLISCGYGVGGCGCDGKFGRGTAEAVKAFQAANGLTVDGIVGGGTWGIIRNHVCQVQNALISKGYSVGSSGADGLYGDGTFNAVRAFQAANGLGADGLAGRMTKGVLFGSVAAPKPHPPAPISRPPTVGDVKTYSLARDGDRMLSPHFRVREFRCQDGSDTILISDKLVSVLESIRNHFGKPLVITSGYRTVSHNRKVGGVSDSQHTKGTAADIQISGVSPSVVANYANSLGVGGLGRYPTFTHVDVRSGPPHRWGHN